MRRSKAHPLSKTKEASQEFVGARAATVELRYPSWARCEDTQNAFSRLWEAGQQVLGALMEPDRRLFPTSLVPKYLFGRLLSHFISTLSRGIMQASRAVANVFLHLRLEVTRRNPVGTAAVKTYFRLRSPD